MILDKLKIDTINIRLLFVDKIKLDNGENYVNGYVIFFFFLTFFLQLIMELENCNSHGDHGNVSPSTPQNDNDPTGHKKWYRQASQRLVNNSIRKFHHNNRVSLMTHR